MDNEYALPVQEGRSALVGSCVGKGGACCPWCFDWFQFEEWFQESNWLSEVFPERYSERPSENIDTLILIQK